MRELSDRPSAATVSRHHLWSAGGCSYCSRTGQVSIGGDVRVGKYLLVNVDEPDRTKAESSVAEMCQKLLANPVIEEFRFDLEEIPAPTPSS